MKKSHLLSYLIIISHSIFFISCDSDNGIETNNIALNNISISEITFTTAKIESEVIPNEQEIISKGVCWSTSSNTSINDNKTEESTNIFISELTNLVANTTYYYKTYVKTSTDIFYSEERTFKTLDLKNTDWDFTTIYPSPNNYILYSRVNLYDNGTTKFDELDLPGQAPGVFITYGTWSLEGNNFTYIWEGSDVNNSTYIYTGTLYRMEMNGTYTHTSALNGTWNAEMIP